MADIALLLTESLCNFACSNCSLLRIQQIRYYSAFDSNVYCVLCFFSTIYCVELKTDTKSYNKEQNKIYKSVKKRIERTGAAFLLKGLKTISKNSIRKPKYNAAIKKFNVPQKDLKYFKNFLIIYLAPDSPQNPDIYYDKLLRYGDLPSEIGNDLNPEWIELLEFLKTLSAQDEKKYKSN